MSKKEICMLILGLPITIPMWVLYTVEVFCGRWFVFLDDTIMQPYGVFLMKLFKYTRR